MDLRGSSGFVDADTPPVGFTLCKGAYLPCMEGGGMMSLRAALSKVGVVSRWISPWSCRIRSPEGPWSAHLAVEDNKIATAALTEASAY